MEIDIAKIDKSDADERVKEIYRLLKKFAGQTQRKEWLAKREDCWDAVYEYDEKSTIWNDEQRKAMEEKGMVPLAINDLYKGVQVSGAVVTAQKPGVMFLPVGSGDLYVAELLKRSFDQTWAQNYGSTEVYEAVKEAKIGGLSSIDARHDPAKGVFGKTIFENYDPTNIYYDMASSRKQDLSDTTIIKARLVTRTYAKETYDVTDEDLTFTGGMEKPEGDQGKADTATGVDNYTRDDKHTEAPEGQEGQPEEKEDVWEIEALYLKKIREIWVVPPNGKRTVFAKDQKEQAKKFAGPEDVVWDRLVEKRFLRIIVGKKLILQKKDGVDVDERENPYGMDADGDPILPVIAMIHDRTRKGKPVSPTVFAKEACRERNKRRTQAMYAATKNLDAPMYAAGDSIKWNKDKVHGDTMLVDKSAPFPPGRLAPGAVASEALMLEKIAKEDIDDMYDAHDAMRGKLPPGDPSGRLVLALQDLGGQMSKPFTAGVLEAALVRLGKVIIAINLMTWTRKAWERLIEPDEMQTWIPEKMKKPVDPMTGEVPEPDDQAKADIAKKWKDALELVRPEDPTKKPGISLVDVDVRITAGSTMPTNRRAREGVALEMKHEGVYDAEAVLDYIDDPKKDQIAARMRQREAAMLSAGMMKGGKG